MTKTNYFVYAIGIEEDLFEPYDNCYIGVTNNIDTRWKGHIRSKYRIGEYIRHHLLTKEHMIVIFSGTEEECFKKENEYRPYPLMGLNEAIGGFGGYTKYSEERNLKISEKLKGRKFTWGDKISAGRIDSGIAKGKKNPKAKKWLLTSPGGQTIMAHGNLIEVCQEHEILQSALMRYLNSTVPEIAANGYGGYRAKNKLSEKLRKNTTGWKLSVYSGG